MADRKQTVRSISALCGTTTAVTLDQTEAKTEQHRYQIIPDPEHFAVLKVQKNGEIIPSYVRVTPEFVEVALHGYTYRFQVLTEQEYQFYQIVQSAQQQQQQQIIIRAPMPGLIKAVTVEPGIHVEHGQRLCILEAMKMENEIIAPHSGIVKKVHIKAGQPVEKNTILCVLEPA